MKYYIDINDLINNNINSLYSEKNRIEFLIEKYNYKGTEHGDYVNRLQYELHEIIHAIEQHNKFLDNNRR